MNNLKNHMENMNNISVIIPTWNRAEFLPKAIESVLKQTSPVFEILICDDGSTDESKQIVKSFNVEYVKWIEGEHSGRPAIPRNRGIAHSKGDWLAFLDSDDEWHPEKVKTQLNAIKTTNCSASSTNAYRIQENCEKLEKIIDWDNSRLKFHDILEVNRIVCSSVMVSKKIVTEVGSFSEEISMTACEDYALWLRVMTKTDFAYCPDPLIYYRDSPGNSVRKFYNDEIAIKNVVFNNFIEWGKNFHEDRKLVQLLYGLKNELGKENKDKFLFIKQLRCKFNTIINKH